MVRDNKVVDCILYEILDLLWKRSYETTEGLTVAEISRCIGRGSQAVRRRIRPLASFGLLVRKAKPGILGRHGVTGQFLYSLNVVRTRMVFNVVDKRDS